MRGLLRELPDDREAAVLGIAACMHLLNVRWRVGTGLDDARALLEEGQTLAKGYDEIGAAGHAERLARELGL